MLPLAVLLLGQVVQASLIHLEAVSLERVLAQSTVVLVVHPAKPDLEERTHGEGEQACFYRVQRHVVDEVLRAGEEAPEVGATLDIAPADANVSCAMQQTMAAGQPVPSPILPGYQPERRTQPEGPRIVYLRQGPWEELAYAVIGAWDPVSEREAVEALLAKGPAAE